MKHLKIYSDFHINEEWSKNDPIPELNEKNKLGIILMGTPGLGKSYFSKNYIQPRQEIKTFSTDDVSMKFTKDPNKYYPGAADLNIRGLLKFMDNGNSFIYDTTGTHPDQIFKIVQKAKKSGYKILFIHLVGPLDLSLKQNQLRDRQVDPEYIEFSYQTQFPNMKTYFNQLHPDGYYIVYNKEGKYKFYKYVGGKLLKRKVDKYVEL
jgi:predicted kinase